MNFVARQTRAPASAPSVLPITRRPAHKWLISYRSIEPLAIASDVAGIFCSSILAGAIYHIETIGTLGDIIEYVGIAAIVSALFISLMISRGLYDPAELLDLRTQLYTVNVTWVAVFLFFAGVAFALKIGAEFSRGTVLLFAAAGVGLLIALRCLWYLLLTRGLAAQKFAGRNTVLIAEEMPNESFVATLAKYGYQITQRFLLSSEGEDLSPIISFVREHPEIEEVLISAEIDHCSGLIKRLSQLREVPITIGLIPAGIGAKVLMRPSRRIGDTVYVELQRKPLDSIELAIKRGLDVICAGGSLVLLLPLLLLTAVAIKLDSPGPAMFRQRRRGFNGHEFYILKFRTMSVLEDGKLVFQATPDDHRVTRVGKWLRHTSIDELPQLWNVLTGSMSLVGPRPHAVSHDNEFDKVVRNYAVRHHVKPGLTGWAQVNGCRGPTPTAADIQRRVEFDLWYIDNWSFHLDCWIVFRTMIEVLRGRNAY